MIYFNFIFIIITWVLFSIFFHINYGNLSLFLQYHYECVTYNNTVSRFDEMIILYNIFKTNVKNFCFLNHCMPITLWIYAKGQSYGCVNELSNNI